VGGSGAKRRGSEAEPGGGTTRGGGTGAKGAPPAPSGSASGSIVPDGELFSRLRVDFASEGCSLRAFTDGIE
jgi:hypothetical protein